MASTSEQSTFSIGVRHVETQSEQPISLAITSSAPLPSTPPPPQLATSPAPRHVLKMSTKFGELFAFSGPTPERINGRLAMIGFVAAMGVELARGISVELKSSGFDVIKCRDVER
ncbi:early light-induced protein, chloroplastic-like [Papaver somniferum]|uniref:early light-induced protein, chloroplastic-like n=1 Tax=Papaver somniferum TaxID=3469 RepID=UPI000E7037EA|nr:early light-induced protein, chloroplastic-like [Papaver somniferum]